MSPSPESQRIRATLERETVDPTVSLQDERENWSAYGASLPIHPDVLTHRTTLSGVTCLILMPQDASNVTILYAHGGGLTTGSIATHQSFASALAAATQCKLVLVDYRLLPENPVAAPRDDILAVYHALLTELEPAQIVFAGDSSGGAVTVSALCQLRTTGKPIPLGNIVISGAFDATLSSESHHTNAAIDPLLSPDVLAHWQTQLGPDTNLRDPVLSPLFADLSDLPPHLLLAGSDELWRDDTLRMAQQIEAAGSSCETHIFEGMWHVWPMTPDLPETDQAFARIRTFIQQSYDAAGFGEDFKSTRL